MSTAGRSFLTLATDPNHDTEIRAEGLCDADSTRTVVQKVKRALTLSNSAAAGTWDAAIWVSPNDCFSNVTPGFYGIGQVQQTFYDGAAVRTSYANQTATTSAPNQTIAHYLTLGTVNAWAWNRSVNARQFFPAGPGSVIQTSAAATNQHWAIPDSTSCVCPMYGNQPGAITTTSPDDSGVRYRVWAMAVEVTNTTAAIYKQGTLTVGRSPSRYRLSENVCVNNQGAGTFVIDNASTGGASTQTKCWTAIPKNEYHVTDLPPATVAKALVLGANQWDAAEGCYSVMNFDQTVNKIEATRPGYSMHTSNVSASNITTNDPSLAGTGLVNALSEPNSAVAASGYITPVPPGLVHISPRDVTCIYLSGLSQQSTFNVEVTFYVEIAPTPEDTQFSTLAPLAQPSPPYDPVAMLAYQLIARNLPPGVLAKYNASGEFWDMIVKLASQILPRIATAAGASPAAAAIAGQAPAALLSIVRKLRQ
jgi:hypothetical protein